jgi:predicted enzyme related to lactoylglutathione lyase
MNEGIKLFLYPVKDVGRAKTLYSKLLGTGPYVDEAYYVGFRVGDLEIGLDPNGHNKGMTGPVGYWEVRDIKKSLKSLLDAGAQTHEEVHDVGGGKLVGSSKDADENIIGLIQSP